MCIHQTQTSTTAGWKNSNETFSLSSHCIYIQRTFSCGGEQLVGLSVWSFAWVARCEQLFPVHTRSHERAFKLCGKIVRKSSKVHAKQRNSIVNINLHTTKCIPLRKNLRCWRLEHERIRSRDFMWLSNNSPARGESSTMLMNITCSTVSPQFVNYCNLSLTTTKFEVLWFLQRWDHEFNVRRCDVLWNWASLHTKKEKRTKHSRAFRSWNRSENFFLLRRSKAIAKKKKIDKTF